MSATITPPTANSSTKKEGQPGKPRAAAERAKLAKVGVIYRHNGITQKPVPGSARYVAVVNGLGEFAPVFEDALRVERAWEIHTVLWLGDGAVGNWRLNCSPQVSPPPSSTS